MSAAAGTNTRADRSPVSPWRGILDHRLDFFRGLALMFIFIDHIQDNRVSYFTLRSFAFCDAAEVFIFISGCTAALAYTPVFDREGVTRVYRRVWQLYVAHVCLFMIFNAEVAYTLKFHHNPLFYDELQVGNYLENPGEAFIRVLLLQFQPSLLNILPLYIALLLVLPFFILAIRRHFLLGLVPSATLYLVASVTGWNMPGFPEGRLWFFNPFAWQFLFAIAVSLGFARTQVWALLPAMRWLPPVAPGFAAVSGPIALSWSLHDAVPRIPKFIVLPDTWFDKTMLPPARLVGVLALAVVADRYVSRGARFIVSRAGWLVVICGQNSLHVFCLGILLAVLANFILNLLGYGAVVQIVTNLIGLAIMAGVGVLIAWFKAGGRLPDAPDTRAPA
ncbi:MAG: OpgC domain-containing protein [Acetobacteraceae bacterium]|nr:OpgC domain-containing protein [Acetobacteraceae bacterium]